MMITNFVTEIFVRTNFLVFESFQVLCRIRDSYFKKETNKQTNKTKGATQYLWNYINTFS